MAVLIGTIATITGYSILNEEQLPIVMRAIDSSFLTNDFFVNANAGFGPRFYFANFISLIASVTNLPFAYLFSLLASNILITIVTAFLTRDLFEGSNLAGILAAVVVMSLFTFTLGLGAYIPQVELTPGIMATPLVMIAIWAGYRWRPLSSAFAAGLASLIHPLLGLETGIIVLLALVIEWLIDRRNEQNLDKRKVFLRFIGAGLVLGLFAAFSLVPYSFAERIDSAQFIYLLAYFRHPHHYLPSTFASSEYLSAVSFLIASGIAWYWWQRNLPNAKHSKFFLYLTAIVLLLCAAGYLFVEVIPTRIWTTAQTFRLLILLKWLGLVFMSGGIARLLIRNRYNDNFDAYLLLIGLLSPVTAGITHGTRLVRNFSRQRISIINAFLQPGPILLVVVALLPRFGKLSRINLWQFLLFVLMTLCILYINRIWLSRSVVIGIAFIWILTLFMGAKIFPFGIFEEMRPEIRLSDLTGAEVDIARSAQRITPEDAIFLVPPALGEFRSIAARAIVVDFGSFPFQDLAMVEWQRRLFESYGKPESTGFSAEREMDQNYRKISDSKLNTLGSKYDVTYAILYKETMTSFSSLYENQKYKLVEINQTGSQ